MPRDKQRIDLVNDPLLLAQQMAAQQRAFITGNLTPQQRQDPITRTFHDMGITLAELRNRDDTRA